MHRWLFLVLLLLLPARADAATSVMSEQIRAVSGSTDPGKAQAQQTFVLGKPDDDEKDGNGGGDGNGPDDGSGGDADTRDPEPRGPVIGLDWDRWTTYDHTAQDAYGHVSETNAQNLSFGKRGVPNNAMCLCVESGTAGYAAAPGYGNDWNQAVYWTQPAPNELAATNVKVSFVYNHDTEPGRDFFGLQWNQGGTWVDLLRVSGSNKEANGAFVNQEQFNGQFDIQAGEYTGPGNDEIRLRLLATSDPFGSDEDGLFPSSGAAQVDEIRVLFNNVLVSASGFDPTNDGWTPSGGHVAGDFAKILPLLQDLDPCYANDSFTFSFVDDGTPTHNTAESTGGETSINWSYGPGAYVVNHSDGVSNGRTPLHNSVQSWVAPFNPGVPGIANRQGAMLWFRVWKHLPLENGIFYDWSVRSYGGGQWSAWRNHGMAYYSDAGASWERRSVDVSNLMVASPESVQVRLGVVDLAASLGLPGGDATASPMFDDVGFSRYDPQGPVITTFPGHLFQDSFANKGTSNWFADPDARTVRLDMARDIGGGGAIVPGDSIVITARAFAPATSLTSIKLVYALRAGPFFAGTRVPPAGGVPLVGTRGLCSAIVAANGFQGEIIGTPVTNAFGDPIPHHYSFDLPDGPAHPNAPHQASEPPFFLVGDELQYYIEAIDNLGRKTRLPRDITGFGDFTRCSPYDPEFTIHALPGLGAGPSTPNILVVQDGGGLAAQQTIESAFQQIGLFEGVDYDHFRVMAPGAGLSNGLGATGSKGASSNQLSAYSTIVWFAEDASTFLLNDGSGQGLHDKSNDQALLTAWRSEDADRFVAYFGSNLASGIDRQTGGSFTTSALASVVVYFDVRPSIDDQDSPGVVPTGAGPTASVFSTSFTVGGCLAVEQFDAIEPTGSPNVWRSHRFLTPAGVAGYSFAAALWHDRMVTPVSLPRRRVDATFPFAFASILDPPSKIGGISARALLLGELLAEAGHPLPGGTITEAGTLPRWEFSLHEPTPNPFNPATELRFVLPTAGTARMRLYDLRGRTVATLVDAHLAAGAHDAAWRGQDASGRAVASGVYFAVLESGGLRSTRKLVLVR